MQQNGFWNYKFTENRFNGCNTVWGVFALINLLSRSIALFDSGSDSD